MLQLVNVTVPDKTKAPPPCNQCSDCESNGALELPNGASALTARAWLLWMLQVVNVTVPPSIRTPPPCKPRRVLTFGQFRERASIGALERWCGVRLHGSTYILPVKQSKTVTWRETSSHVNSTVPSGHWNEGSLSTVMHSRSAHARVEAPDDVS